ncbi:hypothetical protein V2J09_012658 [Rumex salicifolius]
MGMKFLNKKGWHTGSLRNIENVWKAEQKNELEKKKLEELRKQIQEEKERSEFRRLQEQAGLVPRQERLEFLYDSGLSVGKPSSDTSFKSLEPLPQSTTTNNEVGASSSSAAKQDAVPGALFEEKQQSANDTWRKLHSDPLLMIRQREQEALARIKNNPVKMAMIRKSVEAKKQEDDDSGSKKVKRKHRKHSSSKNRSDSEDEDRKHKKHASSKHRTDSEDDGRRHKKDASLKYPSNSEDQDRRRKKHPSSKHQSDSDDDGKKHQKLASSKHRTDSEDDIRRHRNFDDSEDEDRRLKKHASSKHQSDSEDENRRQKKHTSSKYISEEYDTRGKEKQSNKERNHRNSKHREYTDINKHTTDERASRRHRDENRESRQQDLPREEKSEHQMQRKSSHDTDKAVSGYRRRNVPPKLTEEERAAKLREMQMDAELHEDQRWRRLKKADENDAKEAIKSATARGKSFLDAAQESVYGAEQGGSSTIEESVRRRSYFRQSRSAVEGNAFRSLLNYAFGGLSNRL